MNRVQMLLTPHADKLDWLVEQGKLTRERATEILTGHAELSAAEIELVADACAPAFAAPLLAQLIKDDQKEAKAKMPAKPRAEKPKTSPKSSSTKIGRHNRPAGLW